MASATRHWRLETPAIEEIEEALVDLHSTGLKVMYTELDVNLLPNAGRGADPPWRTPTPPDFPMRSSSSWRRYADIFGVLVKHRDGLARHVLGLSDADSWLNRGRMNYPLLWDRQRQPKPAFQAVADVLTRAVRWCRPGRRVHANVLSRQAIAGAQSHSVHGAFMTCRSLPPPCCRSPLPSSPRWAARNPRSLDCGDARRQYCMRDRGRSAHLGLG